MSLNPFDALEKLITEHGSAAVLSQHLAFVKEQFQALEKQVAKLEARFEIEQDNHKETKQELQRVKEEHFEEVRIHRLIEFRRGKRTGGKWMAFCPKCHLPVGDGDGMGGSPHAYCTAKHADCGWSVYPPMSVAQIITGELEECLPITPLPRPGPV